MKEFEKKGWFRVTLPAGWQVDEEEEPLAIYHPEGGGALQVTWQAPRPLKPGEKIDVYLLLRAFLRQSGVNIEETESRRFSERGLDWASCEYSGASGEEVLSWRVWMVTNHDIVVFLTYACREEDRDLEREAVDGILATLELR
jgi:hypothetical protein